MSCGALIATLVTALTASGCVAPPKAHQAPLVSAEETRRIEAEATEARRRQHADLVEQERRRRAEQDALAKQRAEAYAAGQQVKINALPAFRSQLKTGDRVKSSSGYMLGTVVEVKRPLVLVQLEIVEFPNRRYEMRWLPIEDLIQPDF